MITRLLKFPFMLLLAISFICCDVIYQAWRLTLKYEEWEPGAEQKGTE